MKKLTTAFAVAGLVGLAACGPREETRVDRATETPATTPAVETPATTQPMMAPMDTGMVHDTMSTLPDTTPGTRRP